MNYKENNRIRLSRLNSTFLTHPLIPSLEKRGEDPYIHERELIIKYNRGFPSPFHGRGDIG
jgi:hypothetical protein